MPARWNVVAAQGCLCLLVALAAGCNSSSTPTTSPPAVQRTSEPAGPKLSQPAAKDTSAKVASSIEDEPVAAAKPVTDDARPDPAVGGSSDERADGDEIAGDATATPDDPADDDATDKMADDDAADDDATDKMADDDAADDDAPTEPFVPESNAVSEDKLLVPAEGLARLDPDANVWIDKANKRVVLAGEVCRRETILEMFACIKGTKEHESIVSVHCKAMLVHAGLLAVGAEPGHPARFQPEYSPAEGPEIEITVLWKDENGEEKSARAQDWIRSRETAKALDAPFIFGGSGFWTNERTGDKYYLAEQGDLICVSNFASALMDLPIESSDHQGSELFEPFTERIPAEKTPVTLLLTPQPAKPGADAPGDDEPGEDKPAEEADGDKPAADDATEDSQP